MSRDSEFSLIHRTRPAGRGNAPYPALILLHGLGSNEMDLLTLGQQVDAHLYVVSVRAPEAYRWGGFSWFDFETEGPGVEGAGIQRALQALEILLGQAAAAYTLDPARIYLAGFSQGAAMTGAFTLTRPDQIAAAIMLSGFLPPDTKGHYQTEKARDKPFFLAHGTADPLLPVAAARMTRDFLASIPVDLTYREYPIGHTVSEAELGDLEGWIGRLLGSSAG